MKKIWFIGGIILIIVIIFLLKPVKEDTILVSTTPVVKGDLTISILSKGVIQPQVKYKIKSKLSGIIKDIKVKEGDKISAGEILLSLDPTEYIVRIKEIERDILAYKNKLYESENSLEIQQLQNTFQQAKLDLENASREYESYERLYKARAVSNEELQNAHIKFLKAKMNYEISNQNLIYKQQIINNEKNLIQTQLQQANAQLEWVEKQLKWTKITSPISGVVIEKDSNIEIDSPINSGMPLFTIADLHKYQVEALIDEVDKEKIYVGQRATIKVDAYPYQLLSGKITSISPQPIISSRGIKSFKVTINFDRKHLSLTPEMNCDVELITTIPNVIKVPSEAIIESGDKKYVFVVKNGKSIRKQIKTKLESATEVQVVSGISIGDRIITNPPSTLKEDVEVKIKGKDD